MKGFLLDTNLLIALLWPSHAHHGAALRWFKGHRSSGWATCPITQSGFVRIVANPAFSRDAVTAADASAVLAANLEDDDHHFWPDDASYAEAVSFWGNRLAGHQQVTDAYLLGLAIRHGGVLATFDTSIGALLQPKGRHTDSLQILRA